MRQVFLRMEEASTDGMEEYCENNNGDKCYFGISGKECPRDSNENIICCGKVFIQDTIIPQQLVLYDEMLKASPLKIKITVRDCALEMQVLEQDERLRGVGRIFKNHEMGICSDLYPALYLFDIYILGSMTKETEEEKIEKILYFDSNDDRDAYLSRVKKLMHDFKQAWQAGEVEVGR